MNKFLYNIFTRSGIVLIVITISTILLTICTLIFYGKTPLWLDYLVIGLVGSVFGWFYYKQAQIYINFFKKNKTGIYYRNYIKGLPIKRLQDMLRHIIFHFNIQSKNRSFFLDVKVKGKSVIQVMHRAHFPELCENEEDVDFGLAIYVPVDSISKEQEDILNKILHEESQPLHGIEPDKPVAYIVIDVSKRIKYSGYLMARMLKEVFHLTKEEDLSLELFDEGVLPYEKIQIK